MKKWRCGVCGYVHEGDEPPVTCPVCGADKSLFEEIIEKPPAGDDAATKDKSEETTPPPDTRGVDLGPAPTTPLGRVLHFLLDQMLKHHAHPISVHFPNGVLPVAFIFTILAVLLESRTLEMAAYCNLVFVVLALPLVLFSGYVEWQKRYMGLRSRQFMVKIGCAVAVSVLSLVVVVLVDREPRCPPGAVLRPHDVHAGQSPGSRSCGCGGLDRRETRFQGLSLIYKTPRDRISARDRSVQPRNTRTYLKKRILVQNDAKLMPNVVQGGREVQPGGILEYFEDLNRAPNAEFGPKDCFEMGSIQVLRFELTGPSRVSGDAHRQILVA